MISIPIWLFVLLLIPLGISLLVFLLFAISELIQAIINRRYDRDYIKHLEEKEKAKNEIIKEPNQQD